MTDLYDMLSHRYILEAPDTQATNESQAFKIHVLIWLYDFYLRSYWLYCCTDSPGSNSRHLSLKLFRAGHSTSQLQTVHPPRVPPYSSMTSRFQFTGYWYSLFPWAPNFSIQIMGVKSPERSKGNSLQSKIGGSYYPHSYPYISWGIHQIPVGHLG